MFKRIGAVLLFLVCAIEVRADFIVVPNANATTVGQGGIRTPIADLDNPFTYQVQFSAAQLSSMSIGQMILGVQWRMTSGSGNNPFPSTPLTWANYDITLAQATGPTNFMSTSFVSNMLNPVVVRSGPLTVQPGAFPAGNISPVPNEWGVQITFAPYIYQGGDLVLTLTHTGADLDFSPRFLNSIPVGQGGLNIRALNATGYQAATGSFSDAVISRLEFIPEPSSFSLLALAGASLFRTRRRPRSLA